MIDKPNTTSLIMGVKSIKLNNLLINENLFQPNSSEVEASIAQLTSFSAENELGVFSITMTFRYIDTKVEIFSLTVTTEFRLIGLTKLGSQDDNVELAFDTIVSCLSMALGHTRTYISQLATPSVFKDQISLPIFNPVKIAEELYPNFLKKNEKRE